MSKLAQTILSTNAVVKETNLAQDILSADADLVVVDSGLSLVAPANGETGVALQPPFSWTDTESRGLYRLSYSTSANLTGATVVWTENTSYTPPSDLASNTYYWKVESYDVTQEDVVVPDTPTAGMVVWDANTDPAPIYVYDQAAPRVVTGANDLADYIATSSNKTAPTVQSQPESFNFPQRCIKVGYPNSLTEREEIQIKCSAGGPIELTGVDVYDSNNPDYVNVTNIKTVTETDYMNQAGSYNAVMTFLHDYIGIVWGWIGDVGEAVPTLSELSVDVVDYTHTPSCITRQHLRWSTPGSRIDYGIGKELQKRHRNFYSLIFNTGHELRDMYDQYHPDGNPGGNRADVFAVQPGGIQDGFPYGDLAKLEVGRTALDEVLVTEYYPALVDKAQDGIPQKETFSCKPNDAYFSGHSRSTESLALDYRDPSYTPRFPYRYANGQVINDVPISDRRIKFAIRLKDRLRQETGFENAFVSTDAYGPTRWAPQETYTESELEGIYIELVANEFSDPNFTEGSVTGNTHAQNMDDYLSWRSDGHIWRPNISTGYGHQSGLPLCQLTRIGARFKSIINSGVTGFSPDNFWEHYSTQWPMYYMISQLMWDHTQDVTVLMDKAYNTLFGNAATHIKAYYEYIEGILDANLQHSTSYTVIPEIYTTEVLDTMTDHINFALGAVTSGTDEYLRVEYVEAGLDWTKGLVRSCEYFVEYNSPAVQKDGATNEATNANAIEDDTDGTAGWELAFGGSLPTSQSGETNGSNFAWFFDYNNSDQLAVKRTDALPGGNLETGTATGGDVNTLIDTSKTLTLNQYADKVIRIKSGLNDGEFRKIVSNTTDGTFELFRDLPNPIEAGVSYEVSTLYLVSFDAKHTGVGGDWFFDRSLSGGVGRTPITTEDTEWETYQARAFGGETLRFRWNNDNGDGAIYVDNLTIFEAEPVDRVSIANAWTFHNNQFTNAVQASKWGIGTDGQSPPIGNKGYDINKGSVPTPDGSDVTDPEAGLE